MQPVDRVLETILYVDDLDAATAFYQDILGLELYSRKEGLFAFFKLGEAMLLLFDPEGAARNESIPAHGAHGPGHACFAMAEDQLDAWRDRLIERGVAVEQEVTWPNGHRSFYFRDPARQQPGTGDAQALGLCRNRSLTAPPVGAGRSLVYSCLTIAAAPGCRPSSNQATRHVDRAMEKKLPVLATVVAAIDLFRENISYGLKIVAPWFVALFILPYLFTGLGADQGLESGDGPQLWEVLITLAYFIGWGSIAVLWHWRILRDRSPEREGRDLRSAGLVLSAARHADRDHRRRPCRPC